MQKPRLTQKTAEALDGALPFIRSRYRTTFNRDEEKHLKRTLEYLEDLLRWHREKTSA